MTPDDIRELRERLDLRQADLGEILGLPRSWGVGSSKNRVRAWEAGTLEPQFIYLRHLRTLVAVGNALAALDCGKSVLAKQYLEGAFNPEGAKHYTDEQVEKAKPRHV